MILWIIDFLFYDTTNLVISIRRLQSNHRFYTLLNIQLQLGPRVDSKSYVNEILYSGHDEEKQINGRPWTQGKENISPETAL